jgi:hypothetical protein
MSAEIVTAEFKDEERAPLAIHTASPLAMLTAAAGSMDIEKLRALMDMQKELEDRQARQAYVKAMAAFKADPPRIFKDKSVSFGQGKASYSHARLGEICRVVIGALAQHGLSHAWSLSQDKGTIRVTCTVTHEQGHHESVVMEAPPDDSPGKNPIQKIASTKTYLERYTLLAITGLAAEDDDDGRAAESEERRRNVGQYREPGERREEPRETAPDGDWRDYYPDGWKEAVIAGKTLGELPDKEIGMLWKKAPLDPILCAWAADWIEATMTGDWKSLTEYVPGTPANMEDCLPANLWAVAAYLRKVKAEGGSK